MQYRSKVKSPIKGYTEKIHVPLSLYVTFPLAFYLQNLICPQLNYRILPFSFLSLAFFFLKIAQKLSVVAHAYNLYTVTLRTSMGSRSA